MASIAKKLYNYLPEINQATLSGAIDVIVSEGPDGTLQCTPFHVRFGKFQILQPRDRIITVEINGQETSLRMKLGSAGEAYFTQGKEFEMISPAISPPLQAMDAASLETSPMMRPLSPPPLPPPIQTSMTSLAEQMASPKSAQTSDSDENGNIPEKKRWRWTWGRLPNKQYPAPSEGGRALTEGLLTAEEGRAGEFSGGEEGVDLALTQSEHASLLSAAEIEVDAGEPGDPKSAIDPATDVRQTGSWVGSLFRWRSGGKQPATSIGPEHPIPGDIIDGVIINEAAGEIFVEPIDETDDSSFEGLRTGGRGGPSLSQFQDDVFYSCNDLKSLVASPVPTEDTASEYESEQPHEISPGQALEKSPRVPVENPPVFVEPDENYPGRPGEDEAISLEGAAENEDRENEAGDGKGAGGTPPERDPKWIFQTRQRHHRSRKRSKPQTPSRGFDTAVSEGSGDCFGDEDSEVARAAISDNASGTVSDHDVRNIDAISNPEISVVAADTRNIGKETTKFSDENRVVSDGDAVSDSAATSTSNFFFDQNLLVCQPVDISPSKFNTFAGDSAAPAVVGPAVQLAICRLGKGGKLPATKEEMDSLFDSNLVDFEKFSENPAAIIADADLFIRVNGHIYPAKNALPILISILAYNRLPPDRTVVSKNASKRSWMGWLWGGDKATPPAAAAATSNTSAEPPTKLIPSRASSVVGSDTEELGGEGSSALRRSAGVVNDQSDDETVTARIQSREKLMSLYPSREQLQSLPLKDGANKIVFKLMSSYVEATMYKWPTNSKIVISDIDGTITKSDVLGHILPLVGADWSQRGVAGLLSKIRENGYQLLYLTARPIGQISRTKNYLQGIHQDGWSLPEGPVLTSPDRLLQSFTREVIRKKPQEFKIACLRTVAALFDPEPFHAGFGNRITDNESYACVGVPSHRTFIINSKGEIKNASHLTFKSSYESMQKLVDMMFTPIQQSKEERVQEQYNDFNFWRFEYRPPPKQPEVDV